MILKAIKIAKCKVIANCRQFLYYSSVQEFCTYIGVTESRQLTVYPGCEQNTYSMYLYKCTAYTILY
jgi:hypothetical protein